MKRTTILFTSIFSLCLWNYYALSQTCVAGRYLLPIFTNTDKTSDIVFGTVPSVTNPYVAENITYSVDLEMDIFEPSGDTLNLRPAVILTFGGGYLLGGKDDEDIQLACDSLARRGFVTASIQYRLGMNILNTSSAERAVYRGVQDMGAAVRYLKEYRSTYRIDTNFIFIGGVSAGAINALHLAFAEENDRPASTYASGGLFPAPDLGCANCSGNNYNHNGSNVKAVINCWGAIGDLGWIDPGEDIPIASFHGDADLIVPYDSGYPFSALATMPYVYGSNSITTRANTVGLYNEMNTFPGEGHNIWGTVANNNFIVGPTQYFGPIIRSISDFLFTFLKPQAGIITGTDELCQGDTATYLTSFTTGSIYCWSVTGGTIISSNPYSNTVEIVWDNAGIHNLHAVEQNYFLATGDTMDFAVQVNPTPVINAGMDQAMCEGDSVSINGSGASLYQWFPDSVVLNSQSPSTYAFPSQTTQLVLIGTDNNGCVNTDTLLITVDPLPVVNAGMDQEMCNGDSISINGSGASLYEWFPDSVVLNSQSPSTIAFPWQTTQLVLVGTDSNGCANTDAMTILVNDTPQTPIIWQITDTLYTNSGFAYQWFFNDALLFGENQNFTTNLQEGYYAVEITDSNGCTNNSAEFPITGGTTGIIPKDGFSFRVSPNPGSGKYSLQGLPYNSTNPIENICIYDHCGRSIAYNLTTSGNSILVDISNAPNGLYLLKVGLNQKEYFSRLVKN